MLQTESSSGTNNYQYELLLSNTADNVTRSESTRKSEKAKINPYTGRLYIKEIDTSDTYLNLYNVHYIAADTNNYMKLHSNANTNVGVNISFNTVDNANTTTVTGITSLTTKTLSADAFNLYSDSTGGSHSSGQAGKVPMCAVNDGVARVYWGTVSDTKNTTGSTDTSSKIYLVGATSQAANPQTYSDNQVYATDGQLDANKVRVAE